MGVSDILAQIDREIALLQQAHSLLSGAAAPAPKKPGPAKKKSAKKKRVLSAEGRKAIADAARKRWAERRKAAAGGK